MKLQEEILKRSLLNEGRSADWIDWDQRIKEHEKKRDEENRLREIQVEKKTKKKISMELMHLCINTLREESVDWRDGVEKRELERKKVERLSTVVRKKAIVKEDQLQKKLLRSWMKLPE